MYPCSNIYAIAVYGNRLYHRLIAVSRRSFQMFNCQKRPPRTQVSVMSPGLTECFGCQRAALSLCKQRSGWQTHSWLQHELNFLVTTVLYQLVRPADSTLPGCASNDQHRCEEAMLLMSCYPAFCQPASVNIRCNYLRYFKRAFLQIPSFSKLI